MCQDFEELLASFNAAGVRYLVGGAHALALHARPRATKDLELFVDPTKANAARVLKALRSFFGGAVPSYVSVEALLDADTILQLGVAPVRVDILSSLATTTFRRAYNRRAQAMFGSVPADYLSRDDLVAETRHFDRPQDRADVEALLRGP
ncbi:MAG: hypothetical protein GXP55_12485 [Deltaproteobacteria bacterium]|nr:hypothetical protein [Deltaproteobacteria bacterium]